MDFYLEISLLVATAVLHMIFLPTKLVCLPSCERGNISIYGEGPFCMINQGILHTEVVLHYHEFSQLIGFSAEEMLCLEVDYPYNGCPSLPLISACAAGLYFMSEWMIVSS